MDAISAFLQQAWQNIVIGRGIEVTLIGLFITFLALSVTSLFITAVPRLLVLFNKVVPLPVEEQSTVKVKKLSSASAVSNEIVAAIGTVHHLHDSAKKQ